MRGEDEVRGPIGNTDPSAEVGRRVAERLAASGIRQRLVVSPDSPAPNLPNSERSTTTGYGDLDSMQEALAGVETLFLIPIRERPERARLHAAATS